MKLIIDIHNRDYNAVKNGLIPSAILDAIKNGVPLPKGHGNLIDVSEYFNKEFGDAREFLDKATTIIEADKTESEDKEWN